MEAPQKRKAHPTLITKLWSTVSEITIRRLSQIAVYALRYAMTVRPCAP